MDIEENEISLLDLLLVVAENLKLLILGPIVVGLLALAIGYALPQSFTSQAILAVPTPLPGLAPTPTPVQAAAMMVSPLVLDPVIQSLGLSAGLTVDRARVKLTNQVKVIVGKDGLLRLDATANSPLEAQKIADAVIDTWLTKTVPGEKDRADLNVRLIHAKASLESVHRLLDHLAREDAVVFNKRASMGGASIGIAAVGELQARYQADVLAISRLLQGFGRDIVVQSPTLPTESISPQKTLIAFLVALGTGFALLLWVFMRQAWRNAALDPETAEKQSKLRVAIGLKD